MSDSDSPVPLTPNHLLTFRSNVVVHPPGSLIEMMYTVESGGGECKV